MIKVNGKILENFKFPAGEIQVRVIDGVISPNLQIDVTAVIYNSDDIMELLLFADAAKRVKGFNDMSLYLPYLPYARQDRVCAEGEALSIKVFCDLINSLACFKVTVDDPHSDVAVALLNNCAVVEQHNLFLDTVQPSLENVVLVCPDAGARKKILKLGIGQYRDNIIYGDKVRCPHTGEITHTKIDGNPKGRDVIIVDDICDGGRTFIELSKVLKEKRAKSVKLYVTHGIFSKGLQPLYKHFSHVFCHHTFLPKSKRDDRFLTVHDKSISNQSEV